MSSSCKTCVHWRDVKIGERPVRLDDVTVRNCTAQPPQGDYRWPRTMEHHVCGCHSANAAAASPVQTQVADLLNQVDTPAAPAPRKRRGSS